MLTKVPIILLSLFMAGCMGSQPEPILDVPPQVEDVQPLVKTFAVTVNLTTYGTVRVGDNTFGLNPPNAFPLEWEGSRNCVVLHTAGGRIHHLNATAQWTGGDRLVLFHWMRDEGPNEGRDHNDTAGTSPLQFVRDYAVPESTTWVFLGVVPDPEVPVGVEIETPVIGLHIELQYEGEGTPSIRGFQGCAYPQIPSPLA